MERTVLYMADVSPDQGVVVLERMLEAQRDGLQEVPEVTSGHGLLSCEERIQAEMGRLGDLQTALLIVRAHSDPEFRSRARAECRERYRASGVKSRIHDHGDKQVSIRLRGGSELVIRTPYLRPSRKGRRGRPRKSRGRAGEGCYPLLVALGISDGMTPATKSRVARQSVMSSSLEEAQQELQREQLELDVSTLVRVANSVGAKALEIRDQTFQAGLEMPIAPESSLTGKTIRVSMDGGRARTRRTNRKGRKKKNGRHGFELQWKEPRLITVDVLDEKGEADRRYRPIYETTLGDADDTFRIAIGLLRYIGACHARHVVFVSDGASWIWERLPLLLQYAEIAPEKVTPVLDYFHACEHIADAVAQCKNLKLEERQKLCEELCREMVKPDGPVKVIERLQGLARGRRGKAINKEITYLEKHLPHMAYAALRARKLPIGSGVVESAIRRVVNLRFKAAGMCWTEDHLASLLYLRAIHKAGWWDEMIAASLTNEHWLAPQSTLLRPSALPTADKRPPGRPRLAIVSNDQQDQSRLEAA